MNSEYREYQEAQYLNINESDTTQDKIQCPTFIVC